MLQVHSKFVSLLPRLVPLFERIAACDAALGDQVRRAAASVVLNYAEGYASMKGNRGRHFRYAFASLKETRMALQMAMIHGYIGQLDEELVDGIDHVAAMGWRLMGARK